MDVLTEFVRTLRRLRRDESGVAMMLTLAVVLVLYILCSGVYAIGETIREKIEMQNACDAAAYSAAVVQADGLSRMAMVNRALSWTYVQLTNMQIDYITHEWLSLVAKRFKEDWNRCRNHSRQSASFCFSNCGNCAEWFRDEGKGWFCGVYGLTTVIARQGSGSVKLNNNRVVEVSQIDSVLNRTKAMRDQYHTAIPELKKLINTLNGMFFVLDLRMQTSIDATIEGVLHANLPRTSDGKTDVDAGGEFLWRYFRTSPQDPYESGGSSGYFSALRNTEVDERVFLSMADGKVHKEMLQYFSSNGEKAGGLDQWFIRSDVEDARNGNATKIDPMEDADHLERSLMKPEDMKPGICRVYKNANRYGTLKHTPNMRAHHSNVVVLDDPPSCNNTHEFNGEQCIEIDNSVALYADYEWRAVRHWCACETVLTLTGPKFLHEAVNVILGSGCQHHSHSGLFSCSKSHSRNGYSDKSCFKNTTYHTAHVVAAIASATSCEAMKTFLRFSPPYYFARIYGDDYDIYDSTYYTGEVAKPWVLNRRFFSGDGSIVVALARKQKNPWGRLVGMKSGSTSYADGIYQLFNPTEDGEGSGYLCAFSAGRAAYHFRPSQEAEAYGAVERGNPRDYETRYDAVCDADRMEIQGPFAELQVGCVCGEDNARRYARCWNLCETDWDAVLVPVRFARTNAGKYDSLVGNDVFWEHEIKPGSNLFQEALTAEVNEDEGVTDGWHPFYVNGRRVEDPSEYVYSGDFLKTLQPFGETDNDRWLADPDAAFKLRTL